MVRFGWPRPTAEEVASALRTLDEAPHASTPRPTGTGELDDGHARGRMAGGAVTVLLGCDPAAAFDALADHLRPSAIGSWGEAKRAELILEFLLYQVGWSQDSTWNALREQALRLDGRRPDPRWVDVCARLLAAPPPIDELARELGRRLGAPSPG